MFHFLLFFAFKTWQKARRLDEFHLNTLHVICIFALGFNSNVIEWEAASLT